MIVKKVIQKMKIHAIYKLKIEYIFFIAGIFSTFTAFSLCNISIFYWLLLLIVTYKLFLNDFHFQYFKFGWFEIYVIAMTLSVVFSLLSSDMPTIWKTANIKKYLVFMLIFGGLKLFFSDNEKKYYLNIFLKGLKVSAIVQMIWGLLEYVLWHAVKMNLNVIVFDQFFHINFQNISWNSVTAAGTLRIAGIGWEPAYFALAMVAGYLLCKNPILKMLFILVTVISTSRTGYIILFIAIIGEIFLFRKKRFTLKFCKSMIVVTVLCLFLMILVINNNKLSTTFLSSLNSLINWSKTTSGGTHFNYIKYIPNIFSKNNVLTNLFGYGSASSGYPYSKYYADEFINSGTWSTESDFINTLWGCGILGLVGYYGLLLQEVKMVTEKSLKILIICSIIGGFFYIYNGTWIFVIFMLCDNMKISSCTNNFSVCKLL